MTFEKQGPHNTEAALKLAIEAAREEGIHKIVVASSTGATAKKLAELEHEGIQIIDVGYARGVFGKHEPQMSDEMRQDLEAMGVTVYVASHALRIWPGGGGCPCAAHHRTWCKGVRGNLHDGSRCRSGGAA